MNKNLLIIGGSTGIGAKLVEQLSEGSNHVFASFNKNPKSSTSNVTYFPFKVETDNLEEVSLPDSIDGLVYCPGAIDLKPFHRIKPESFRDDFELQVMGAIKVIQSVLPKLQQAETCSVILFSTVAVNLGFNFHSKVAVSKGAIEGLTRSLAAELSPRIRVNAIAPSLTDTPLASKLLNTDDKIQANSDRHPLKRIGSCLLYTSDAADD